MQQPIIPGEVLILHDPDEPECLLPPKPSKKARKWLKRSMAGVAMYGSFVAADNVRLYQHELSNFYKDGEMIEDATGCEPFRYVSQGPAGNYVAPPTVSPLQIQVTIDTETQYAPVESAAHNFRPAAFNPFDFAAEWYERHGNEFASFTSAYSGAEYHLYSDTENSPFAEVNTEVVDELLHASLRADLDIGHVSVSDFLDCARQEILLDEGGSLLAGERINLYISNRPGSCWSNGLVQDIPMGADSEDFCDSNGFTLKDTRFAVWPFYEYEQSWMGVMSTAHRPKAAQRRVSRMLIHESQHLYQQYLGIPFKLHPNEALADYIEDEVVEQLYSDGLPRSVVFED